MDFTEHKRGDLVYLTAPTISARHGFSTRLGGVSQGDYASLNLRVNCSDSLENVRENYRRLGQATGIDTGHMAFTHQVHGNVVRRVTEADVRRLGSDAPYEADGLVTDVPGLALICFTADCVPVLLHDPAAGVAAAVHCGWRSSVADILRVAVEAMCEMGAAPDTICAGIGPAIGGCCFQVGREVIDAADAYLGGDLDGLYRPDAGQAGKYFLDLKGANARRLEQLGLPAVNIAVSDACTICRHEIFWSHRYTGGRRGAQGALIVI